MPDLFSFDDKGNDAAFVGWCREPGGRWRRAAAADDRWACWSLLRAVLKRLSLKSAEGTVLERGRKP